MEQCETKPCPFCAEDILFVALKCKHCGEYLPPPPRKPIPLAVLVLVAAALGGAGVGLYYYLGIYRPILAKGPGRILYGGDQPVTVDWTCKYMPDTTTACWFKNISTKTVSWCVDVEVLVRKTKRTVMTRKVCGRDIPPGETVFQEVVLDGLVKECTYASNQDWTTNCELDATSAPLEAP